MGEKTLLNEKPCYCMHADTYLSPINATTAINRQTMDTEHPT